VARHVYPNLRSSVVVYATLNIATAILTAAGLGFLGLGSKPPTSEWGLMVADGRDTLEIAWWVTAFPGLAILLTTLVIYTFGERLNAALDPKRTVTG
jgi:ABC-type dipeptide/oligopeptide/nickel transport system permease subunit